MVPKRGRLVRPSYREDWQVTMSAFEPNLLSPELDLSASHIRGWWGMLPRDFKAAFGEDVPTGQDDSLRDLAQQMVASSTRGYPDVLWRNADLVAAMGRPRRIRMIAWIVGMCWPESEKVLSVLTAAGTGDAGDAGEAGSGSTGGRGKIAPLFRSDLEALAGPIINRGARAVADRGAVRSVESGIRDFEDAFGRQIPGAM